MKFLETNDDSPASDMLRFGFPLTPALSRRERG